VVCGNPDFITKDQSVKYFGKTKGKKLAATIKGCRFVSHLAFMDCCPNSVVEALVCGKNILHTNSGGMQELVKDSGFCVDDKKFDYKMIDLYKPPPLDMNAIVNGYHSLIDKSNYPREDLFIDKIAQFYASFFRKTLK